jgi:hypothetical protein
LAPGPIAGRASIARSSRRDLLLVGVGSLAVEGGEDEGLDEVDGGEAGGGVAAGDDVTEGPVQGVLENAGRAA